MKPITSNDIYKRFNIKTDVIEIPNVGRTDLAQFFCELNCRVGVEIGVAAGEYSHILMRLNPQLTLYGVDPYMPYKGYKDYVRRSTFEALRQDAKRRLDQYPNYHFVEDFSPDASIGFEDNSLDFVYLDGNHSEPYVTQDINGWWPRVRPGGILAGHDYARINAKGQEGSKNWAVIPAVKSFAKANKLTPFIWGLEAKITGLKRDGSRSWMLIKP